MHSRRSSSWDAIDWDTFGYLSRPLSPCEQSIWATIFLVNVHFESELTSRQERGRLRLTHPHWPAYSNGVGIILCDVNICDPEEGRFIVWNQTFTDGDPAKDFRV